MQRTIILLLSSFILHPSSFSRAASTITTVETNQVSYGANTGWFNWYADGTNGAVLGEFVCSGYIYAANIGWIHLGSGSPADNIQYSNTTSNDFGVNHLGDGRLRGYAYGANIGWLNFEETGNPRINLLTGSLTGYAYSANCGWISLSNQFAQVKTDTLAVGPDSDGDGIPDSWELFAAGNLTALTSTGDADGDGMKDVDEYRADTNPLDAGDRLRITAFSVNSGGTTATVTWTSRPSRLYQVHSRDSLVTGNWSTNTPPGLVVPDGLTTTRQAPGSANTQRFFRVQALLPLAP
jgi:hypothetical protein